MSIKIMVWIIEIGPAIFEIFTFCAKNSDISAFLNVTSSSVIRIFLILVCTKGISLYSTFQICIGLLPSQYLFSCMFKGRKTIHIWRVLCKEIPIVETKIKNIQMTGDDTIFKNAEISLFLAQNAKISKMAGPISTIHIIFILILSSIYWMQWFWKMEIPTNSICKVPPDKY